MTDPVIREVVNGDGTKFEPPENPLMAKWLAQYPPTPKPEFSQVCDAYSCMFCGRCPYGDRWKVPEEDKEEYAAWAKEYHEYINRHNSFLKEE